jgi:hypothetical protein
MESLNYANADGKVRATPKIEKGNRQAFASTVPFFVKL